MASLKSILLLFYVIVILFPNALLSVADFEILVNIFYNNMKKKTKNRTTSNKTMKNNKTKTNRRSGTTPRCLLDEKVVSSVCS